MRKEAVLAHFGGVVKTAKALGLKQPAVSRWSDPIPEPRAWQIQILTNGALKYEPKMYRKTGDDHGTNQDDQA
jgi:hypothetical protein